MLVACFRSRISFTPLGRAICTALLIVRASFAEERPSESEMFGTKPGTNSEPTNRATAPQESGAGEPKQGETSRDEASRDRAILGGSESPMFQHVAAPEDPLKVGGQLYLRAQTTASSGQSPANWSLGAPAMLDVYMDNRPNDRVRGFALFRMVYDPTLPVSNGTGGTIGTPQASGSISGSSPLTSLVSTTTRAPVLALDQLWLRGDIARTLFFTAGKQHVRWGTGRFWMPTDFLHLRRRNPLDVFDARTGTTMLKLHVPIESKAWNFYAYGILEDSTASPTLGHAAAAARAEFVFGAAELGLGMKLQRSRKPQYACDLSVGVGEFDFYGELALRHGKEIDRVRYEPDAMLPDEVTPPAWQSPDTTALLRLQQAVDSRYPSERLSGVKPQAVGGISYSGKYWANDVLTIGAEFFYNAIGYSNSDAYLGLVLPRSRELQDAATFFYLGRYYGVLYLSMPAPYSLERHSFTLSTLTNLSDRSVITRLDYSLQALTHLRFEAFAALRYGSPTGEFRFGITEVNLGGFTWSRAPAIADFGLALRAAM